jgi:ATP-binding cassette, subfamily B, bacterial
MGNGIGGSAVILPAATGQRRLTVVVEWMVPSLREQVIRVRNRQEERPVTQGRADNAGLADDMEISELPGYDVRLAEASLGTLLRHAPGTVFRVLRIVWQATPALTLILLGTQVLAAVTLGFGLLNGTLVIAALVTECPIGQRITTAAPAIVFVAASLLIRGIAETVSAEAEARLTPCIRQHAEDQLYRAAIDAQLAAFDDADWYEALARCRDRGITYLDLAISRMVELVGALAGLVAVGSDSAYCIRYYFPCWRYRYSRKPEQRYAR